MGNRIPYRGEPDTVPWGTGYRTVGNRIPYRGEPDTVPWGTGYRTVGNRHIFIFKINQILIAYFCAVKGFKRYLKEKTRARRQPVDNFPVRLPPDPPQKEFASLTSFLIGRGAVAPSQTLPREMHRNRRWGHHRKTQKTVSKGRRAADSSPKQPRRGSQKGQKATKTAFPVSPLHQDENTL